MATSTIKSSTKTLIEDAFQSNDSRVSIIEQKCTLVGNVPVDVYIKLSVSSSIPKWNSLIVPKNGIRWDGNITYLFSGLHDTLWQRHANATTGIQNASVLDQESDYYIIVFPY